MTVSIQEWQDIDAARFRGEVLPAGQPVVLRGLARDWPAVRAGLGSADAMAGYLRSLDVGATADTMYGSPEIRGHFFYRDDLLGLNFERRPARISDTVEQLLALRADPAPPSVYLGSAPLAATYPKFLEQNVLPPLLEAAVVPRIWIGNRVTVQTHFDISDNLACVVHGRRRFTLFPPDQLPNLYVGPLDFTLAGQPVSLVKLADPDLAKYPRFASALPQARVVDLEPGDALYIPYMWWHHVESLDPFNVLVNYWWDDARPWTGSPLEALVHTILSVRDLPPERRAIWGKVFGHYVFGADDDTLAHLAPRQRGILGESSPRLAAYIKEWLVRSLGRR